MSFILDALKKSETDRQRQSMPGFADLPQATSGRLPGRWLWVLVGLLVVNAIVIAGVWLRPATPAGNAEPVVRPAESPPEPSFASIVEEARQSVPRPTDNDDDAEPEADDAAAAGSPAAPAAGGALRDPLPTFTEARLDDGLQLPDLHLDIHVYSDNPAERFVFINMAKYREHATLTEGPQVDEIRPDGVILSYNGTEFLLRRE